MPLRDCRAGWGPIRTQQTQCSSYGRMWCSVTMKLYIMCVCVFIKLHITAQSGPVILVIICHSHWSSQGGINDTCYVCVCVCVCVFIKLHITAQSGPVILVILCHCECSSHSPIGPKPYPVIYAVANPVHCTWSAEKENIIGHIYAKLQREH